MLNKTHLHTSILMLFNKNPSYRYLFRGEVVGDGPSRQHYGLVLGQEGNKLSLPTAAYACCFYLDEPLCGLNLIHRTDTSLIHCSLLGCKQPVPRKITSIAWCQFLFTSDVCTCTSIPYGILHILHFHELVCSVLFLAIV